MKALFLSFTSFVCAMEPTNEHHNKIVLYPSVSQHGGYEHLKDVIIKQIDQGTCNLYNYLQEISLLSPEEKNLLFSCISEKHNKIYQDINPDFLVLRNLF